MKLLINSPRMLSAFIGALRRCSSYDCANDLSQILSSIISLSEKQIDEAIEAFNDNDQLRGSYGFNGGKPGFIGDHAVARSTFTEAVRRRPGKVIILRQKSRVLADSRR